VKKLAGYVNLRDYFSIHRSSQFFAELVATDARGHHSCCEINDPQGCVVRAYAAGLNVGNQVSLRVSVARLWPRKSRIPGNPYHVTSGAWRGEKLSKATPRYRDIGTEKRLRPRME
jgi:hypothetical protein